MAVASGLATAGPIDDDFDERTDAQGPDIDARIDGEVEMTQEAC